MQLFRGSLTLPRRPVRVRSVLAVGTALAVGGLAGACTSPTHSDNLTQSDVAGQTVDLGVSGEGVTIGLTYVPGIQFSPVYVAGADGIFRAAGIGASIRHHGADEGLFTALVSGEEDVTIASGDEVLQARAAGMDLVSVGAYYHDYPVVIAAKESSGITSVPDLAGKRIGLPGEFGSNWFGLLAALDEAGMTTSDITVVPIGYTQAAALASDQVDAVVGFVNSDVVQLQSLGVAVNVIPLTAGPPPLVGASIVTTTTWAQNNPELLRGVVGAITSGVERVLANPQHALEVTSGWDRGLSDPQARKGALAILDATLPLWRDSDGSASAVQDLHTWEMMGDFLGETLDDPSIELQVDKSVTNEYTR